MNKCKSILLKFQFRGIIVGVIVGVTISWLTTPKPELKPLYAFTSQKPYKMDALGQLHLNYKETASNNHFELLIDSIGTQEIKDLEIDLVSMKKNLFSTPTIIFNPTTIKNRMLNKPDISPERIYLKMTDLPQDTGLAIDMNTNNIGSSRLSVGKLMSWNQYSMASDKDKRAFKGIRKTV